MYRVFFRCGECGCFITTETQKGHNYLRCTKRKNLCSQKYTREEIITSEIQKEIKKVSLQADWASWMLAENRKDMLREAQSSTLFADNTKANNRFELTEKFLKYNIELANEVINEEKLHLFKKVGSNFQIKDRTVLFEPRGAWKILSDSEFFEGNTFVSALRADHIFGGNLNSEFWRRM